MKSKILKLLGIVTAVSMLAGMLFAVPAMGFGQPVVSVSPTTIGATASYNMIISGITKALATGDEFVVLFPTGTNIAGAGATVGCSSGIGTTAYPLTPAVGLTVVGQQLFIAIPGPIGVNADVQIVISGVVNPATAGSRTLTVKTQTALGVEKEAAVVSTAYNITNPTIPGLPGVVTGYNSAGVPIATSNSINGMIAIPNVVTITVGPGTYDEDVVVGITTIKSITSTDGAAVTIIKDVGPGGVPDGNGGSVDLANSSSTTGLTFDGFTVYGNKAFGFSLRTGAFKRVTVQNCTIKTPAQAGAAAIISQGGSSASALGYFNVVTVDATGSADFGAIIPMGVSYWNNCIFNVDTLGTAIWATSSGIANVPILYSTQIIGAGGTGLVVTGASKVSPSLDMCTFTGLDQAMVINFDDAGDTSTMTMKNTVIDGCGNALNLLPAIDITSADRFDGYRNTVKNSPYYIAFTSNPYPTTLLYNDFGTGNAKGFWKVAGAAPVLTHNWWGGMTVPSGFNHSSIVAADVAYPVGAVPVGATVRATAPFTWLPSTGSMSPDFYAAQQGGACVTSVVDNLGAVSATVTMAGAASFETCPQSDAPVTPLNVINYVDVFIQDTGAAVDTATVRFYKTDLTSAAQVLFYDAYFGRWDVCSNQFVNVSGAFVTVMFSATTWPMLSELNGSYFAVVDGIDVPGGDPALTPKPGTQDVSITPSFSWTAMTGAIGYDFQIADNSAFSVATGDTTAVNGYIITEPLEYSTQYWWRVRAYNAAGVRSGWVEGTFKTMAKPIPPTTTPVVTPTVIITQPPQSPPTVTILPPTTTVEEKPVIPEYLIWIVIAVGAILVIVVIVLIVRTRRIG